MDNLKSFVVDYGTFSLILYLQDLIPFTGEPVPDRPVEGSQTETYQAVLAEHDQLTLVSWLQRCFAIGIRKVEHLTTFCIHLFRSDIFGQLQPPSSNPS